MDEPKNGMLSEKKPDTQTLCYMVLFTWNAQKSKSGERESRWAVAGGPEHKREWGIFWEWGKCAKTGL